jgi:hypothetical protein
MDYSLLLAIEKNADPHSSVNTSYIFLDQAASRHQSDNSSSGRHNEMGRLSAKFASVSKNRYELESDDGKFKYHVALIDYLQEWNLNKKLERLAKIHFKNADP